MVAFVVYVMKWAFTLTLLYSLYGLLLRRETFHGVNRVVLLSVLFLAMVLPFCRVSTEHVTFMSRQVSEVEQAVGEFVSAAAVAESSDSPVSVVAPAVQLSLWPRLLVGGYMVGVVVCFAGWLLSLLSLVRVIRRGRRVQVEGLPSGVRVVVNESLPMSCSWMRWIVLSRSEAARRGHPVLEHELSHVRLGHSWDMLFCEFTARMLWFLPFAWMLRKDMRDLHEYQADRQVLRTGIEEEAYQHLLIRHAAGKRTVTAANSFDHSSVKKRLVMMCRRPSTRRAALKAVYLLPLAGLAVTAFARPTLVSDLRQVLDREASVAPLLSPVALAKSVETVRQEPEPVAPAAPVEEEAVAEAPAEEVAPQPEEMTDMVLDTLPAIHVGAKAVPAVAADKPAPAEDGPVEVRRIAAAPITPEEFFRMQYDCWIEQRDGETYVKWFYYVRKEEEPIQLDGEKCFISDMKTGDRYMCRRIEGYPDKKINIRLMHYKGSVVQFTLVFPPLEDGVKKIAIFRPGQRLVGPVKLKKIVREVPKIIR